MVKRSLNELSGRSSNQVGRTGNELRRSEFSQRSYGASKFDTFSQSSVRPSTSFMGLSRKEAIERQSQVPRSIFNPLTDQMTGIVGHSEHVLQDGYKSSNVPA